jgi:site-specific DNA-methyltransferase (adenine-specific)
MINKIFNENCLDTMAKMPDCFIDLTITSPPYDNLRQYNGYSFQFEDIAKELYRVTKNGGVVVWIVGDATIKGCETLTSFKQALFFNEIGFSVFDTMIYFKSGCGASGSNKSYLQSFEYMFILTKGSINTTNLISDRKNKKPSSSKIETTTRRSNENNRTIRREMNRYTFGRRFNVWQYNTGNNLSTTDKIAFKHPAIFPEQLAHDHIISWSNENDLIYDPFIGSGTTAKMAIKNNRKFIGSEMSSEYFNIAQKRISETDAGGLFFNSNTSTEL